MLLVGVYVLVRHGAICLHGDWKNTHRRFCRWRDKGVWDKLFNMFLQDPDFEWLMIEASYIKVYPHTEGGLNSKIHLAVDASDMPVEVTVTSGTVADSSQADKLISDIEGQYLLAERAYDTNYVLDLVTSKGMEAVIPAKRNRKKKREHNQEVYKIGIKWRRRF